jgi:hypothetical protein
MRMLRIATIAGIPVNVHWSLIAGAAAVLAAFPRSFPATLFLVLLYVLTLLLHEWGHVLAARWRGCEVLGIDLYVMLGRTRLQSPESRFDHCVIAWGGVALQAVVGFPMFAWIKLVGLTSIGPLDATLATVGFLSVVMVPLNLAPVYGLDGAIAWQIMPMLWERARRRPLAGKPAPDSTRWKRWG